MNDLAHHFRCDADIKVARRRPIPFELLLMGLRIAEILVIAIIGTFLSLDAHLVAVITLIYASIAALSGAYDADISFSGQRAWERMLRSWIAASLMTLSFQIMLKSRILVVPWRAVFGFVIVTLALALMRTGFALLLRQLLRDGRLNQRMAIYGVNALGRDFHAYVTKNQSLACEVVGFFDERNRQRLGQDGAGLSLRGDLDALIDAIRRGEIDQVVIALPWSSSLYLRHIVTRLTMTPVRIRLAPDKAMLAYPNREMTMLGNMPMMTLFERPISGLDALVKRAEDCILAILLLLMALPVLVLTALAIKLDSPGPIFFRQPREGFNNQHFRIWKFRSMQHTLRQTGSVLQATRHDPRITRVGAFIRRTSIDELPQLFNVLSGEMSLVGPRPHAPSTLAGNRLFPDIINTYAARHKVKPGITGWAQACGWRGETDTEDKLVKRVEHDLHYIEHWSVGFDLYILLRTLFALIGSRAY